MSDTTPIADISGALAYQPAKPPERTDTLGKDAFLKLLVAQLRYQNPLSPSDPNQFMAQTAQFTMVEKLSEMTVAAKAQRALAESLQATSLLGREITWVDTANETRTGVVTGTGFGADGTILEVGDERVPLERVAGARPAPVPAPAPNPSPTTQPQEA